MDDIKAAEILKSLAAGMDPAAGQPLTSIAPLQSPDVVRALFLAADSLEMRLRQSRRQSTLPRNAGKPWSSDEDERLLAGFDAGTRVFDSVRPKLESEGLVLPAGGHLDDSPVVPRARVNATRA